MKTRFIALMALVLGMASCQRDITPEAGSRGEVNVQLSVAAPELLGQTRTDGDQNKNLDSAYGAIDYLDGSQSGDYRVDWNDDADLRYSLEIYDADEPEEGPIKDRMVIIKDKYEPVNFELRLIPGRNYRFVLFADFVEEGLAEKLEAGEVTPHVDAQTDLGLRHTIGATLKAITIKQDVDGINDELADAYFKSFEYTPADNTHNYVNDSEPVELTRPYGKVRIVTTDLAELNTNVHPKSVKIVYSQDVEIPTSFNALSGKISGIKAAENMVCTSVFVDEIRDNRENHYYNHDYDAKTATAPNGTERASHLTLATDYILGENQQNPIQFTMYVYEDEAQTKLIKEVEFSTQIPVQRNYLTTIIGNFLTANTKVTVTISDKFEGSYDYNYDNEALVKTVSVANCEELAKELKADNLIEGTKTIKFANDIVGNISIPEIAGKGVVIDGNGYKYDGCIALVGGSSYNPEICTVIENVNFETADCSLFNGSAFIYCNEQNGNTRYPDSMIVRNCTFTATGAAVDNAVGIKLRSLKGDLNIENCSANGLHSLVQLLSCGEANVCIDGVTIANAKNGISLEKTGNAIIRNSNISTTGYGVRADGCNANTTIENTTIAAAQPVIVRKVTTGDYNLSFVAENNLIPANPSDYQVIFTNGKDDEVYVKPVGKFTLNGADNFIVYPVQHPVANVAELAELVNNATEDIKVAFLNDIEGDVTLVQNPDVKVTVNGRGHNFAGCIVVDGKSKTYTTAGMTIKNVNFVADAISADACVRLGDGTNATRYVCNLTVDNCTFDVPGAVAVKSYTGGDKNLVVTNCVATANAHSLVQAKGIDGIFVQKCTVNSKNGLNFNNSTNVTIDNCNVDVRGYAARFGEGSKANGGAEVYNIKNSTLKSSGEEGDAVIVLRGTADKSTLTLTNTTLIGEPQINNTAVDAEVVVL